MKILIIGASGYIGKALSRQLSDEHEVYGTYATKKTDLLPEERWIHFTTSSFSEIKNILEKVNPQVVLSCLRGDFEQQLAAHRILAEYCQYRKDSKVIFFSTANVFDADLSRPHFEEDQPIAESDYGKYKIECERLLSEKLGERAVILRIPGVWGKDCPRILDLIERARSKELISSPPGLYINLALDVQIAECVEFILLNDLKGCFHIGTKDYIRNLDFLKRLSADMGFTEAVFEETEEIEEMYFAVLPGREEIPKMLLITVEDAIEYLVDNQER